MGHDDRGNPYLEFIYTGNKVGEELVYAVPSGWGMAVYPIFICTYPVERLKPAVIEVIYSKKGQGPLVGIAPVIEEKRPSRVEKEWSFQDESLNHSHPFETNVWYKYVAQAARQAKHSDCFVCSHMPHSTSQPIAYATPINITSAKCAFNVSLLNASTVQCTHTPLFKPGKGKPPGLKMKTQHHHFQCCLGQDQPKLDPVIWHAHCHGWKWGDNGLGYPWFFLFDHSWFLEWGDLDHIEWGANEGTWSVDQCAIVTRT